LFSSVIVTFIICKYIVTIDNHNCLLGKVTAPSPPTSNDHFHQVSYTTKRIIIEDNGVDSSDSSDESNNMSESEGLSEVEELEEDYR
jgi:hypothetical protein